MFVWLVCLGLVSLLTLAAEPALAQQPGELLRPSPWSGLPHGGLNGGHVLAIAAVGNDLFVGGGFSETADGATTGLNRIAKFSNGQWTALPNEGLNGAVHAMAVIGNDLYVGGAFSATADGEVQNLNQIAKFSNGAWSALPNNGLGCGRPTTG